MAYAVVLYALVLHDDLQEGTQLYFMQQKNVSCASFSCIGVVIKGLQLCMTEDQSSRKRSDERIKGLSALLGVNHVVELILEDAGVCAHSSCCLLIQVPKE